MTNDNNDSMNDLSKKHAGAKQNKTVSDLPPKLAKPAQRALAEAGYTSLEQLTQVSEEELLKLHGMGPKAVGQLREALAAAGLSFVAVKQD